MIPLEGRILPGLDEFMLRVGHLKVLCTVARESGGPWLRIEKAVAAALTTPVAIQPDEISDVAYYLWRKKFCPAGTELKTGWGERSGYRYPDLFVELTETGQPSGLRLIGQRTGEPTVWWQDLCLAAPGIPSRVGAVTAGGKAGSKTGVSHLCDWAKAVDLLSTSGQLAPEGHLLANFQGGYLRDDRWIRNPYLIGNDRIVLAYVILLMDFDVFSRFALRLADSPQPLRKTDATRVFVEVFQDIAKEADAAKYLTAGQQYRIFQQVKELTAGTRHAREAAKRTEVSSTAWHRASSRLENYVDFGFLDKGRSGEDERYEYVYYRANSLARVTRLLNRGGPAQVWLEEHLVSAICDKDHTLEQIDSHELESIVPPIIEAIRRPTGPVPLTPLALGLAWLKAEQGHVVSIAAARRSLEEFARRHPDAARLSRGGTGERAEFVTFLPRRMSP